MVCKEKLTNPVKNIDEVEDSAGDNTDNHQEQFEQQETIFHLLEGVMNDLTYAIDNYVAIMYNNKWYPGKATEVIKIA